MATSGDYTADKISDGGGKVIMTAAERSKLANINTCWTSLLTTDPAVAAKKVGLGAHDLRSLLIFYAAPIIINAVYDPDCAAAMLARYDDVVLGAGLQAQSDPNYATTSSIIKLAALAPNTVVWGYIDIALRARQLPAGRRADRHGEDVATRLALPVARLRHPASGRARRRGAGARGAR